MSGKIHIFDQRPSYPWGRKSPKERKKDLEKKLKKIEERRDAIKLQVQEIMIKLDREEESISNDIAIADTCEKDRIRSMSNRVRRKIFETGVPNEEIKENPNGEEDIYIELLKIYKKAMERVEEKNSENMAEDPWSEEEETQIEEGHSIMDVVTEDDFSILFDADKN